VHLVLDGRDYVHAQGMPPKIRGLEKQHLIVTEGRDDQIVVERLVAKEGASQVQVMHCQGRDNLENKIRAVASRIRSTARLCPRGGRNVTAVTVPGAMRKCGTRPLGILIAPQAGVL
jgi:hypothetical protein